MSEKPEEIAAFPSANAVRVSESLMTDGHAGMTLRDYFAAAAMQGLLSSEPHNVNYTFTGEEGTVAQQVAEDAYTMADAMLKSEELMTNTTELLKYAEGLTWRPISEAPRDGTPVLVRHLASKTICVSFLNKYGEWRHIDGAQIYEPNHFMPLPDGQAGEIIKVLVEAMEVMRQALREYDHAQQQGAQWYTKGDSGLWMQTRMWLKKGVDAYQAARSRATAILRGDDAGK